MAPREDRGIHWGIKDLPSREPGKSPAVNLFNFTHKSLALPEVALNLMDESSVYEIRELINRRTRKDTPITLKNDWGERLMIGRKNFIQMLSSALVGRNIGTR